MTPLQIFGLFATGVHLIAYVVYNRQIHHGGSTPNLTSWSVFVLLSILNATSYYGIDTAAWHEAGPPMVGACCASFTLLHSLSTGKFQRPTSREGVIFFICMIAVIVYIAFQNATYVNFIVLAAFVIAIWPIMEATWRDPSLERPPAWIIWTCGYGVLFVVVWFGDHWEKLALPIVAGPAHITIAVLSRNSRRLRFATP